jgi:hypothetical protein
MSPIQIKIPGEDAWIIERLGRLLTWRLVHGQDSSNVRQSLIRFLFGLQRLPMLIPDLRLSLEIGQIYVEINSELFGLESFTNDGHTGFRLQYFEGSNHCLYWNEFLVGADKRNAVETRLQELESDIAEGICLSIEDYSTGEYVDAPSLDDYMEYALSYEAS